MSGFARFDAKGEKQNSDTNNAKFGSELARLTTHVFHL